MKAGQDDLRESGATRGVLSPTGGHRKKPPWLAMMCSVVTLGMLAAVPLASSAAADATTDLKSAVDGARGGCPVLQQDSTLDAVAARANSETNAYIQHTAKFVPFEDALPVLRDLGYPAAKAKLLAGYGDAASKAVRGVVSQGFLAIPDCGYSKYGVNTFQNPDGSYSLAAVVLAGG
jgi:hypothetical protein